MKKLFLLSLVLMGLNVPAFALNDKDAELIKVFEIACRVTANEAMTARQNGASLQTAKKLFIKEIQEIIEPSPNDSEIDRYEKPLLGLAFFSTVDSTYEQAWQNKIALNQTEKDKLIADFMKKRAEECQTFIFNELDDIK